MKLKDGSAPNLCNIALEYVIRQMSAEVRSTIFYKSVQLGRYADDINIMGRTKRDVSEAYKQLEERAKEVGFNIRVKKTKPIVQNRRRRRISGILAIKDHDIEAVRSFKYLGTAISNTDDEQKKSKLESWLLIRPIALCNLHSDLNKFTKITK